MRASGMLATYAYITWIISSPHQERQQGPWRRRRSLGLPNQQCVNHGAYRWLCRWRLPPTLLRPRWRARTWRDGSALRQRAASVGVQLLSTALLSVTVTLCSSRYAFFLFFRVCLVDVPTPFRTMISQSSCSCPRQDTT
jgi:hypothetical protein